MSDERDDSALTPAQVAEQSALLQSMIQEAEWAHKRVRLGTWISRVSGFALLLMTLLNLLTEHFLRAAVTGAMLTWVVGTAEYRWIDWLALRAKLRARIADIEQSSPLGDSP